LTVDKAVSTIHRPLSTAEFTALLKPLKPQSPIAVAVSGGADSMALALLAHAYDENTVALTVDHGLRKEAALEAKHVGKWLKARGMEHHTLKWKAPKAKQTLARDARHALMAAWCKKRGITQLLLAHHQGDQAETLLLRLKRGSHITGLAAMQPVAEREGLILLRPLLALPKARLIATCKAAKQAWVEDPSNENMAHDRNRLRKLLAELPNREEVEANLAKAAEKLGELRQAGEREKEAFLEAHFQDGGLDAKALEKADKDLAFAVLSQLLANPYPPRFTSLERLYGKLTAGDCRATLSGCIITRRKGRITIRPERA
jgi:tRNA(Ile)-lysidine synthase